jgi:sigma-B regulation protein RsbU (phosphoserine phosphatase)
MNSLLWLRIIFISLVIQLNNYSNSKLTISSILAITGIIILLPPTGINLLSLELLYYFTLNLFIHYKEQSEQEINKMVKEQDENFAKARHIHQNSLPKELPEREDLSIAAFYQPAEELGGDYYNVFKVDHGAMDIFFNQYFIYMFDVSGHGLDSAILGTFINNTIEDYFKMKHQEGAEVSPKQILKYIDQQYRAENYPDDYLVCLLVGVLDLENYKFTYSSSGFQFPFYKINRARKLDELQTGGLPISSSVEKEFINIYETTIEFKENEMMFFTTDGLLEQTMTEGRYKQRLKEKLTTSNYFHPAAVVEEIKRDFTTVLKAESGYANDDITYLAITRLNGTKEEWHINTAQQNFKEKQTDIINYLYDLEINTQTSITKFYKLSTLLWPYTEQLTVKILTTNDYLMISCTGNKQNSNWKEIINQNIITCGLDTSECDIFSSTQHENKIYLFTNIK